MKKIDDFINDNSSIKIGENELWNGRNKLNEFVHNNFEALYEGACRLNLNIKGDCYAPRRVQINNTRLHNSLALKYADGHKYNEDCAPSEKQLLQTVLNLEALIRAAREDIKFSFAAKEKA